MVCTYQIFFYTRRNWYIPILNTGRNLNTFYCDVCVWNGSIVLECGQKKLFRGIQYYANYSIPKLSRYKSVNNCPSLPKRDIILYPGQTVVLI